MNCTDFELAVQHMLDYRRTELSPEMQSHCDECAGCRLFVESQLAIGLIVQTWQSTAAPSRILQGVLTELAVMPTATRHNAAAKSLSGAPLWGTVCCAAAMIVLTISLLRMPASVQQPLAQRAPVPGESEIVSEALAGLFQGMNAEYAGLSSPTQQVLQQLGELPDSSLLLLEPSPSVTPRLEQPADWRRWDRPVSDRVGQAFDFLWDALPQTSQQSS